MGPEPSDEPEVAHSSPVGGNSLVPPPGQCNVRQHIPSIDVVVGTPLPSYTSRPLIIIQFPLIRNEKHTPSG